jgi:hypothetical protein
MVENIINIKREILMTTEPSDKIQKPLGFEKFSPYKDNFIHLNINIGIDNCGEYYSSWMSKYKKSLSKCTNYDIVIWHMRLRQSLKMNFSATYFSLLAKRSMESKILPAYHYLNYYAVLHSMWSVIYLLPDQELHQLTSITHSKMANLFHDRFSTRDKIIGYNAKKISEDLRFLREYYSYRMPLNDPFTLKEIDEYGVNSVGGFVKQCIQLANLHSTIIHNCAKKIGRVDVSFPGYEYERFEKDFSNINAKLDNNSTDIILDPSDSIEKGRIIKHGASLYPHSINYEHFFDDFMCYSSNHIEGDDIYEKVRTLVARALM